MDRGPGRLEAEGKALSQNGYGTFSFLLLLLLFPLTRLILITILLTLQAATRCPRSATVPAARGGTSERLVDVW